ALHQENEALYITVDQLATQNPNDFKQTMPKISLPDKFDRSCVNFQKSSPLLENFDDFVEVFEATFGDSDKTRTAANKIRKLTQGLKSAASYASEFRQISGDLDWGETVLIDQFRTGLRGDVKNLLLKMPDPTFLNDAITKAGNSRQHRIDAIAVTQENTALAQEHSIFTIKKPTPLSVEVIDGREVESRAVTHETEPPQLWLQDHKEKLSFNLIPSPHYHVILSLSWLIKHNSKIDWKEHFLIFSDPSCSDHSKEHLTIKVFPENNKNQEWLYMVQVFLAAVLQTSTIQASVPKKYQEFSNVFSKKEADKLPENRLYDCAIDLIPNAQPSWRPIYGLSEQKLKTLKQYI
ncbi:12900_t:CDS:2, partial [Cetraspora pellucida]